MYLPHGFDYFAGEFAKQGICSIGIDLRGFGRSEGIKGYIESFDELAADQITFLNKVYEQEPPLKNLPMFLMGHSMGAVACTYINLKHPNISKGLILLSPPFISKVTLHSTAYR